ncbi:uncharacterized protein LOC103991650 isoform X1 [Musa acuminata AAA Group]|uniref:uncharacterized protein LOC103991650 isoform X1 n=1 Tax=Musa acuminata AAA Group TaxID=214697 RepID=UPI0031D5B50B
MDGGDASDQLNVSASPVDRTQKGKMEADATSSTAPARLRRPRVPATDEDQFRVKRRALEVVLENCKRALELLENAAPDCDPNDEGEAREAAVAAGEVEGSPPRSQSAADPDANAYAYADDDELCALLKLKVESPDFLEKLGSIQTSICNNVHADDDSSWDVITAADLREDRPVDGGNDSDQDDYVLVRQEDIVDGIASFMAAYLLALKQTKDFILQELTPNQLQDALCKTFSGKKKKSKLQKAWDGSKVIYNVASWGATAIGIYQNPAIIRAASVAFWSSCRVISKLF